MKKTQTLYILTHADEKYNSATMQYENVVETALWLFPTREGWKNLGSVEVTFEVPEDLDYRKLKLEELENTKKIVQAAFNARITELQSQINNLLALEG